MNPFAIHYAKQQLTFESRSNSGVSGKYNDDKDNDTEHSEYKSELEKDL